MTEYMLIIPDDYADWEAKTPKQRQEVYASHDVFAHRLDEGGHKITGGGELTHPRTARTVRVDATGSTTVTDGPYAEAVEQLSGFYMIETEDLADLEQACGLLAVNGAVEIRQVGRAVEDEPIRAAAAGRVLS